jgi:membrane protein YqaA with SNARE-associated domain
MKKIAAALAAWGPTGVFALAAIDSGGLPIPTGVDALLLLTAATNPGEAYLSALLATMGSLLGSFFLFWIARKGGEYYLRTHASGDRAKRFQIWFRQYGLITVFIPMLLPIPLPAKIFVLSAGAMGVKPWQFLATVAAARLPRYFGLAYFGVHHGKEAGVWLKSHVWHLVAFSLALCLVMAIAARWVSRPVTEEAA